MNERKEKEKKGMREINKGQQRKKRKKEIKRKVRS